jgi:O-antigen/teichoic acid export membrane protein
VSVSDIGILYWIISLITLLSAFSDLWVGESMKFFIPKYLEDGSYNKIKSILAYSLIVQISTWVLLWLIYFYWADFLAHNYFDDPSAWGVIKVFSVFFIGLNIFGIMSQFFLAIQNTLYFKLCDFVRNFSILIWVLALSMQWISDIQSFSYSWIFWVYLWTIFASFLFLAKYYMKYFAWEKIIWSLSLWKEFFKYALVVFLSVQAWIILSQIDMQMIIYLLGTSEAWYYSIYLSLVMIPFMIIGPIFSILLPVFSELATKKSYWKIRQLRHFLQIKLAFIGIFFALFLFIFWEHIAYILFWDAYLKSWNILKYSILFLLFNFLLQINFNLLGWLWKVRKRLYIVLSAIILNTILNFILINKIWVEWAALATWIGWMYIWIMWEILLREFKITVIPYLRLAKNIACAALLSLASYWLTTEMFSLDLSRLTALSYLMFIMIIWFWVFLTINYYDLKLLFREIKKFKN